MFHLLLLLAPICMGGCHAPMSLDEPAFMVWRQDEQGDTRTVWLEEGRRGQPREVAHRGGIALATGSHFLEWIPAMGEGPDLDCDCVKVAPRGPQGKPPDACRRTTTRQQGYLLVIDGQTTQVMDEDVGWEQRVVASGGRPDSRYQVLGSVDRGIYARQDLGVVDCRTGERIYDSQAYIQVLDGRLHTPPSLPRVELTAEQIERVDEVLCGGAGQPCAYPDKRADYIHPERYTPKLVAVAPSWPEGRLVWQGWFAVRADEEQPLGDWSSLRRSLVMPIPPPRGAEQLSDPPPFVQTWLVEHPGPAGVHAITVTGAERQQIWERFREP